MTIQQTAVSMTNAERVRRYKTKLATAGLVQVNVWVPPTAVADLQTAADSIRRDPGLTVARLVDRTTGKLCGIGGRKGPQS